TNGLIYADAGDRFNVPAAALRLGPLQDNGGPTFTHALLCGSPALNAGDNANAPETDQRGFARIVGASADIGAFEAGELSPSPAAQCPTLPDESADVHCQAPVPDILGGVILSSFCADPDRIVVTQDPPAGTMVGLGAHTVTVM